VAYLNTSRFLPVAQGVSGLGYVLQLFGKFGGLASAEAHNMALRQRTVDGLAALALSVRLAFFASPALRCALAYSRIASLPLPAFLPSSCLLAFLCVVDPQQLFEISEKHNHNKSVGSLFLLPLLCFASRRGRVQVPGLVPLSADAGSGLASPVISVNLPLDLLSNGDAVDALAGRFGVVVKLLPDHEGGTPLVENAIRISHHVLNDESDVDKLIGGLTALLTEAAAKKQRTGLL